jgi:hypothetical protein
MGLPSCFLEKKFVKHEKDDDITPFDGILSAFTTRVADPHSFHPDPDPAFLR